MTSNPYQHKWWALIGLCILSFTAFLDFTIVNTAMPAIQKGLHASVISLQWVVNAFTLTLACLMIFVGNLGDIYGRRKIFYIGLIIFGIAAVGAGLSPNMGWLIFFRALQGAGAAITFTVSIALLPQILPEEDIHKGIGIYSAITGAGLAIGPFLGGVIVHTLGWEWVFYVNVPVIILGFILCSFSLHKSDTPDVKPPLDFSGFILLLVSVGAIIYGVIDGGQVNWQNAWPWVYIAIGVVATFLLLAHEKRANHPLLDFSIFSNKLILLAIINCFTAAIVTTLMFFFPLYLNHVRDMSPLYIGYCLIAVPIPQIIVSSLTSKILKHIHISTLLLSSIFICTLSVLATTFFGVNSSYALMFTAFILLGITWGIANAGTMVAVTSSVSKSKVGAAIGSVFTFWNIGGCIVLAISAAIYHMTTSINTAHLASAQLFNNGFHHAMQFLFGFSVLCSLAGIYLKTKIKT